MFSHSNCVSIQNKVILTHHSNPIFFYFKMAETSPDEVKIVVEANTNEEEKEERPKSVIKIDVYRV